MGDIQGTKKNLTRLRLRAEAGERVGKEKPGRRGYTKTEAELALDSLLDAHQRWLLQQPALLLLWTQDRVTRKRVAQLLAKELLTIPVREMNENTPPNRSQRRAILKELERQDREWYRGIEQ